MRNIGGCSILLASSNHGKLAAFRRLLDGLDVTLTSPDDLGLKLRVAESGSTFEENALIKARAYARASGLAALADDSGLCVDQLKGAPGVYSARYGGYEHSPTAQNLLLLEQMEAVADSMRTATFVSVIAFVTSTGEEEIARGEVQGRVTREIRGVHGFGYDSVFELPELGLTYAELPPARKDPLSHRALAMAVIRSHVERHLTLLQ